MLTCQFSLSHPDAFEGGRTRFYAQRAGRDLIAAAKPPRGAALVFPHHVWHDGEAVPRGTKIVMRTDVIYAGDFAEAGEAEGPGRRGIVLGDHDGYVFSVLVLADGRIATGSRDCRVRIFGSAPPHACELTITLGGSVVTALAEVEPGVLVAGARDGSLTRIDVAGGRNATPLASMPAAVLAIDALRHARGIFAVARSDGHVRVADEDGSGADVHVHDGWAWSVRSVGGGLFASAGEDGTVAMVDARSRRVVARARIARPARSLAVAATDALAVGDAAGFVHLLRFSTRGFEPIAAFRAHEGEVSALDATPDGGLVSAGEDGVARRFDLDGREASRVRHPAFVRAVRSWSASRVVTGGYDGCARIVELPPRPCVSDSRARGRAAP